MADEKPDGWTSEFLGLATEERKTALNGLSTEEMEERIERGLMSFIDTGLCLGEIKRRKSWVGLGFDSFEAYAKDRWGMSKSYAYRTIDAAELCCQLATEFDRLPRNESVARELLKLDTLTVILEDDTVLDAEGAWRRTLDATPRGHATAEGVRKVIAELESEMRERRTGSRRGGGGAGGGAGNGNGATAAEEATDEAEGREAAAEAPPASRPIPTPMAAFRTEAVPPEVELEALGELIEALGKALTLDLLHEVAHNAMVAVREAAVARRDALED